MEVLNFFNQNHQDPHTTKIRDPGGFTSTQAFLMQKLYVGPLVSHSLYPRCELGDVLVHELADMLSAIHIIKAVVILILNLH